jgi:threonine dehydrogenase-like Zn-dependent dehydrogenase
MSDPLEAYRAGRTAIPGTMLSWRIFGAGFEHFGSNGAPVQVPTPTPGPDELLLRVDAVGLCFSDVKLIGLGNEHPRIAGRDLVADPTVPGHEAAMTVVAVGENRRGQFCVGDRFIIQADVIYQGVPMAFGYAIPGGMQQFALVGPQIIEGDEGNYLLPVRPTTGYAEAALTEPWACVVASYRIRPRASLKPGGMAWFIGGKGAQLDAVHLAGLDLNAAPATFVASGIKGRFLEILRQTADQAAARVTERVPEGPFDDVIVLGAPEPAAVESAARRLAVGGVMCFVGAEPLGQPLSVDIGRIHYDHITYLGGPGPDILACYRWPRARSELRPDGAAWFIGAAGPMGQMHVQRAIEQPDGPQTIVASDIDPGRLAALEHRVGGLAERAGKTLRIMNVAGVGEEALDRMLRAEAGGFDDIVVLAPVPALAQQAWRYLAEGGFLNIFAGLARGTAATFDLSDIYRRGVRIVGSSGSRIADLVDTLGDTESGRTSTNISVAAVGGIHAALEGLQAVKAGSLPGKVVIFPQITDLPLTPLPQLRDRLPSVYAKLAPGEIWTHEAEEGLLRWGLRR